MLNWLKRRIINHESVSSVSGISEVTDNNLLREIEIRKRTDTLLNTVLTLDIGFTTGSGYFLESESENSVAIIQQWIKQSRFEDVIHQISEDLLASGNCYFSIIRDSNKIPTVTVFELGSVNVVETDSSTGLPLNYGVTSNGAYQIIQAKDLTHSTWRKGSDGFGRGIASAAASRGAGYFSNNGNRIRKQNYFETREGILDLSLKAFASSLPRYLATTSNANEESVQKLSDSLSRIEPLSSLAVSDDVTISEMSLNSRNKIDAMIQVLNQEDVSALASPIQQMWSLRGHSWAAARESVRVMMPFLYSFELTVTNVINEIFDTILQDSGVVEPVRIRFGGNERVNINDVKTIVDIINSNQAVLDLTDPQKILNLLKNAGIDIERDQVIE